MGCDYKVQRTGKWSGWKWNSGSAIVRRLCSGNFAGKWDWWVFPQSAGGIYGETQTLVFWIVSGEGSELHPHSADRQEWTDGKRNPDRSCGFRSGLFSPWFPKCRRKQQNFTFMGSEHTGKSTSGICDRNWIYERADRWGACTWRKPGQASCSIFRLQWTWNFRAGNCSRKWEGIRWSESGSCLWKWSVGCENGNSQRELLSQNYGTDTGDWLSGEAGAGYGKTNGDQSQFWK